MLLLMHIISSKIGLLLVRLLTKTNKQISILIWPWMMLCSLSVLMNTDRSHLFIESVLYPRSYSVNCHIYLAITLNIVVQPSCPDLVIMQRAFCKHPINLMVHIEHRSSKLSKIEYYWKTNNLVGVYKLKIEDRGFIQGNSLTTVNSYIFSV